MFYQLSNMLPQIFRVSSTLTLTSSKHWGFGETLLEPILLTQQTHTHQKKNCDRLFFSGGQEESFKAATTTQIHPPHTHTFNRTEHDPATPCTLEAAKGVHLRDDVTDSPAPLKRDGLWIQCFNRESKAKQLPELSSSIGGEEGVSLCWQTFTTLWHQLPSARDYSIFFFSSPCEPAVSARRWVECLKPPSGRARSENAALLTEGDEAGWRRLLLLWLPEPGQRSSLAERFHQSDWDKNARAHLKSLALICCSIFVPATPWNQPHSSNLQWDFWVA